MANPISKTNRQSRLRAGKALFLVFIFLGLQAALPGQETPAQGQTPPVNPQAESVPSQQGGSGEVLHLLAGRSLVMTSPTRVIRVSLADPSICDALVVSPTQILLNAKKEGTTSLVIWGETGEVQTFDVTVDLDILELTQKLRETFPGEDVRADVNANLVTLSGSASSAPVADKIVDMAKAMVPGKEAVINLIKVPMPPARTEVLLQVRFAEVDRSALNQFGINLMSLPPAKNIGSVSTQQFSPPGLLQNSGITPNTGGFNVSNLLNVFIFRPDINLAATIQALVQRNLLQILAEPNVLTETGKPASFLAGGEFPFPVVQSTGAGGGFPSISIQFKKFGVQLDFTPTVEADGLIHLKVAPEVSALDFTNALTIAGFTVPALSSRRVESEMNLKDGQSFAIAGLMDNRVTEQFQKIPGIGDIPVLGKLFQSRSLTKSKTELLVLVTPRIVQPIPPGQQPAGPRFPKSFLPPSEGASAPAGK